MSVFQKRKKPFIRVKGCEVADVACGIGNVLRNKGCAAAFLDVEVADDSSKKKTAVRLCVIASHLAAHAHKVKDRNDDYWRICRELLQDAPVAWKGRCADVEGERQTSGRAALLDAADLVLFCGDLNYRLDLPRGEAERGALLGDLEELYDYDQLRREKAAGRAFGGFLEGRVWGFRPTFKFDARSDRYDSSKKLRVPSWTDRVLYDPARYVPRRRIAATPRLSPGYSVVPRRAAPRLRRLILRGYAAAATFDIP